MTTAVEALLAEWGDAAALGTAAAILSWDQETKMPPKGQQGRGRVLAVLAGRHHDLLTSPRLAEALDAAADEIGAATAGDGQAGDEQAGTGTAGDVGIDAAHVREARREVARARAVPGELARRLAETQSRSLAAWQQARADDDVEAFAPVLAEIVALTREQADAYVAAGLADTRYDALLDIYEPGTTEAALVPLLGDLRAELVPLVRAAVDSGVVVDESPARGDFPVDRQRALCVEIADRIGYDFDAGRLDDSAHPFTTGFDPGDVRITWRPEPDDLRPGLFGVLHEAGHAMYEQGLPAEFAGTPLGHAASLGIHESQSRLWENQVGRSPAFWAWALPVLHRHLPSTASVTAEALLPALHTVTPSPIRVEADETTYNLHVIARFEIERRLIAGDVEVGDLRELWDDTYEDLLGLRPPSAADGVLQDIHWAMASFGYFPTYTIGNLVAAQLFDAAGRAIPGLDDRIAEGDFAPLLDWLRTNVHAHGRRFPAPDLVERATGSPLSSAPFLAHLRSTLATTYPL